MDELEELRRKRLEQLKAAYAGQLQNQPKQATEEKQQFEEIEDAVKAHFTRESLQRYGILKLAHPEIAARIVLVIAGAIEQGKLRGMLSEDQLVMVLKQLSSLSQKKTRITRK